MLLKAISMFFLKIYFFNFCLLVCKLSFIDNIITVIPFRTIYSTLISNKLWHLWKLHIWGYENKYFNIKLWFYVVGLKTIQVISVTLFTCHWGLVASFNKNKYLEISMETKKGLKYLQLWWSICDTLTLFLSSHYLKQDVFG